MLLCNFIRVPPSVSPKAQTLARLTQALFHLGKKNEAHLIRSVPLSHLSDRAPILKHQ